MTLQYGLNYIVANYKRHGCETKLSIFDMSMLLYSVLLHFVDAKHILMSAIIYKRGPNHTQAQLCNDCHR